MGATQKAATFSTITAEFAQELVSHAARVATENGKPMVITVCDRDGTMKAFLRMDGAPLLSVQISQDKAYTAVAFGIPTDQWHEFIKNDEPLKIGIPHTARLVTFGGGYPIVVDGEIIGGIGTSGGHYTDDMAVAHGALVAAGLAD
ncbi:heme-binding protein [Amycolatopsis acidiphila]|uniref:Heme-binding protein n=1 Tax=Amycolatopsis acidiphila TaxID=715473 RepID=A0A558AL40_9PSEU|nr:heme-binding protein [Amycolatopsis acidiphila]TVT24988.1 heme-binding protein [Amycolatopsis acidiphila]UIJ57505.1 heme-binding protein [Amycolatopsis acidiphila]GHG96472.1 hypothetical protein GCM10017788_75600 [Amycolatopsis acidiphila]